MSAPSSTGFRRVAVLLIVTAAGIVGRSAAAQSTDGPDPTGGLRSRGAVPGLKAAGSSREELVRQWDLDGNGTIDASEASVARARMRRSRMALELDSGIDPVTGKPRVIADAEAADDEPPAEGDLPPDTAPPRRTRGPDEPALPGTRVPDATVPDANPDASGPSVPKAAAPPSSGTVKRPSPSSKPAPAPSRPGSVTGGIRAGAPAARPGYGSLGPKRDLNAGIPLPDTRRQATPRTDAPRGGLLPTMRPPTAQRPGAPAAPTPRPPRVSADEIGGF
jgi:hypothetical protein